MGACNACGKALLRKNSYYCSNKCQTDFQHSEYINAWLAGKVDGNSGVSTRTVSGHIVRYLRDKFQECTVCGWKLKNPKTGRVPLEIDHIDGNSENNIRNNLRLICPNCHSLSENFRNLNYGNGRTWRRLKYIKN